MFFKKNYFVEFEYEGAEGNVSGSTTIRCMPFMVPRMNQAIEQLLEIQGYKVKEVVITNIRQI